MKTFFILLAAIGFSPAMSEAQELQCAMGEHAQALRIRVGHYVSEPAFQSVRSFAGLTSMESDSVTIVSDESVCATALTAVDGIRVTPVGTTVYVVKANDRYVVLLPVELADPTIDIFTTEWEYVASLLY